jgi:hypothetical protein
MMGRPKKPEVKVRKNVLRIRLTEDERAQLDQTAAREAAETSTWARDVLLREAMKRRP